MSVSLASWLPALALPAAALLLTYAALHDIAARTIPDGIPVALATLGVALRLHDGSLPQALLAAALLTAPAGLCWLRGWLGGRDLKLPLALALLLPPSHLLPGIVAVAWCGTALALPYLALRRRLPAPFPHRPVGLPARVWRAERFRLRRGGPLPYGVAIAVGGLLVPVWLPHPLGTAPEMIRISQRDSHTPVIITPSS
jgi:prepilin peptidase CpaA